MSQEERKLNQMKDKVVGGAKETLGDLTNNEELELKGKSQRLKSEAGEAIEDAKERVAGKINETLDKLEHRDN